MTLNQLRYFCLACEKKSITKAADQLFVSQPAISAAIRELEKEYGLKLLERQYKGFQLTEQGKEFQKKASVLLTETEHFSQQIHEMSQKNDSIILGLTRSIGSLVYAEVFPFFVQENNLVQVITKPASSIELTTALENHQIDIAIMPEPKEQDKSDKLVYHKIRDIVMVFAVSENHPLSSEPYLTVPMILKERMVSTVNDSLKTRVLEKLFEQYGEAPDIWQRYDQLTMVIHMIRTGHAIGFLPLDLVIRNKGLVGLPLKGLEAIGVCIAWHRGSEKKTVVRNFINCIQKYYEKCA
ncbi:MAG: LysR family transcriptional regulator [Lachnospiraceae bacterium]|nr:LysR family transcriptional regulator [Lachnospiraceae bacterium]MCI8960940.1 LysR family transcriptional regulator [Lachnospiraceae bacterium]